MARPWNRHCTNCIGILSFLMDLFLFSERARMRS